MKTGSLKIGIACNLEWERKRTVTLIKSVRTITGEHSIGSEIIPFLISFPLWRDSLLLSMVGSCNSYGFQYVNRVYGEPFVKDKTAAVTNVLVIYVMEF